MEEPNFPGCNVCIKHLQTRANVLSTLEASLCPTTSNMRGYFERFEDRKANYKIEFFGNFLIFFSVH